MDMVTPGASVGVAVGTDMNQVIAILEMTSKALADLVHQIYLKKRLFVRLPLRSLGRIVCLASETP